MESISTFYNTFSFFIGTFCICILHLMLYGVRLILLKFESNNKSKLLFKIALKIVNLFYNTLTFGFYIRLALEINEFFVVSGTNELYYFGTYNTELILSIVFAIIILMCSILFVIFLVIFSVSSYKLNEKEHSKLGEFFEGLKVPKKQRLFSAISIIRCSIFSVILIVFVPMSSRVTISILTSFEIFYATYLVFMKPFDEVNVNIIEVLNECILLFMLVSLNILHGESSWSITLAYIYMIVIL